MTHFAEQVAARRRPAASPARGAGARGRARVVVLAFGEGLAAVFSDAGAAVVEAGSTPRPSTGELLEAVAGTGAAEVVVVPNDRDVLPAAEAAARLAEDEHGIRVAVIPTDAQVQGMAALAVHDPARPSSTTWSRWRRPPGTRGPARSPSPPARPSPPPARASPATCWGRSRATSSWSARPGQRSRSRWWSGMLGGGGELVTVIAGAGGEELADRVRAHLAAAHPASTCSSTTAGQERYPLLLGVE